MRLERQAQGDTTVLAGTQTRLLERHSGEFRCRHVEAARPGESVNYDTSYGGTLERAGSAYVQVVADVFCSLAFANVFTATVPVTATDLLYDHLLPF